MDKTMRSQETSGHCRPIGKNVDVECQPPRSIPEVAPTRPEEVDHSSVAETTATPGMKGPQVAVKQEEPAAARAREFRECRLLVMPQAVGAVQLKIWKRGVQQLGGTLAEQYGADVTHVVTSLNSLADVLKALRLSDGGLGLSCVLVHSDWLVACIAARRMVDAGQYLIKSKMEAAAPAQPLATPARKQMSQSSEEQDSPWTTRAGPIHQPPVENIAPTAQRLALVPEEYAVAVKAARAASDATTASCTTTDMADNDGDARRPTTSDYDPLIDEDMTRWLERNPFLRVVADPVNTQSSETQSMDIPVAASGAPPPSSIAVSKSVQLEYVNDEAPAREPAVNLDPVAQRGTKFIEKRKHLFACQKNGEQQAENPNKHITDALEKLATTYQHTQDKWRSYAYGKAVSILKRSTQQITSGADAAKVLGIGKKIADKIQEIIDSGTCQKLQAFAQDSYIQTIGLFGRIWGCGAETAQRWYSQGFRSLEDVRTLAKLTRQQEIGLKYFHEFEERIPRDEVTVVEETVRAVALEIQAGLNVDAVGSYRRGASTCGDVDILITHPDGVSHIGVFHKLLQQLRVIGFLTDDLTHSRDHETYMGVCCVPGSKHRRIDIKMYPFNEYAFALLYFTGSGYFNRSMRLFAEKKGFSLSDKSLTCVIRDRFGVVHAGRTIPCHTERQIFEALGLEYRTPAQRSV
eukprot:TRINITY_DN11547_c0_g1_i1.p1 TRINITY_DN11547_c0_g1~~TRINITY_DN11547_c0_g1_i1.p1  ORF type:complete len:771 (+),score=184.38 TRINITY_DN11547_c0_g1_i1:241-2313(+)